MKKQYRRWLAALLTALMIQNTLTLPVYAWLQPAHMAINTAAVDTFNTTLHGSPKFKDSPVQLNQVIRAPFVSTAAKFDYASQWEEKTLEQCIVHGGYAADESNAYVSMKHFYDPLALSGKHELTDQETGFDTMTKGYYEAIPATVWATVHPENPYSELKAMENYKKSMEIPSDEMGLGIDIIGNFRDLGGVAKDPAQLRAMYLGKAMRGLGEVMHLVADMTQPAHVRNDSHPYDELTEDAITNGPTKGYVAENSLKFPRVDGLPGNTFSGSTVDTMRNLALFTNSRFYSVDSIYDPNLYPTPDNYETPNPSPTFSQFFVKMTDGYETLYSTFSGKDVPMVRKEPFFAATLNKYTLTREFAIRQSEVLLPLARAANAATMQKFFPAMTLSLELKEAAPDPVRKEQALKAGATEYKEYLLTSTLRHDVQNDPQWAAANMEIKYSGPGILYRIRDGKKKEMGPVEFRSGVLFSVPDPATGSLTNPETDTIEARELRLPLPLGVKGKLALSGPAVDYTAEIDDAYLIEINGGGRLFTSPEAVIQQEAPELTLTSSAPKAMPTQEVDFAVELKNPPERFHLEWDFGDSDQPISNQDLKMSHAWKNEADYLVRVRLVDDKRKIVRAEDSIALPVYTGELAGQWNMTLNIEEESPVLVYMINAVVKVLVEALVKPLAQAFGSTSPETVELKKFTLIGETISYTLDLRRSPDAEQAYIGTLTPVGTSTDVLDLPSTVHNVRLDMDKGKVVISLVMAETGSGAGQVPFLTKGAILSESSLTGQWNVPGTLGGTWMMTR